MCKAFWGCHLKRPWGLPQPAKHWCELSLGLPECWWCLCRRNTGGPRRRLILPSSPCIASSLQQVGLKQVLVHVTVHHPQKWKRGERQDLALAQLGYLLPKDAHAWVLCKGKRPPLLPGAGATLTELTSLHALQWRCWHPLLRSVQGNESSPEGMHRHAHVHACQGVAKEERPINAGLRPVMSRPQQHPAWQYSACCDMAQPPKIIQLLRWAQRTLTSCFMAQGVCTFPSVIGTKALPCIPLAVK